jgi:predicted aldo/keto reductase-like oxidoreductase
MSGSGDPTTPRGTTLTRRRLLAAAAQIGIGSLLVGPGACAPEAQLPAYRSKALSTPLPTRPLGRTGQQLPILSLGAETLVPGAEMFLKRILLEGVNCWETAVDYQQGNSERAIGAYFERFPEDREQVFVVTKNILETRDLDDCLRRSLEQLRTDYIDLYLLHEASHPRLLNAQVRRWAHRQKAAGRIRLFGFATHENIAPMLRAGAEAGWIDAIMASYNYHLAELDEVRTAMDRCQRAGVGLLAMKSQALLGYKADPKREKALTQRFAGRGFDLHQARLKVVWDNPAVTTICSMMKNEEHLLANVAASMDEAAFTIEDLDAFRAHGALVAPGYCVACGRCRALTGLPVPVVMRCLMYHHGYGEPERARRTFAALQRGAQFELVDYTHAEARCPQRIPIGRAMRDAVRLLG